MACAGQHGANEREAPETAVLCSGGRGPRMNASSWIFKTTPFRLLIAGPEPTAVPHQGLRQKRRADTFRETASGTWRRWSGSPRP